MLFEFLMLVLAVALGIVVGMSALFVLIMSPTVMNWYMQKSQEMVTKSLKSLEKMDV